MSRTDDALAGIELTDDEYRVVQSLVRNKYRAYDSSGDVVLKGSQKMFRLKEEFPFVGPDGDPVFTVTAGGILDVAGNYTLTDDVTGEPVVVLDRQWTMLTDKWTLRDPDDESVIARIESGSTLADLLRYASDVFSFIPHSYEITDAGGGHVGSIDGRFSLRDEYTVRVDDTGDVPKEAVIAAAMVIDAIEGN
ncbi:LURP-one-related/scramblase family protein [Halococcus sp. IIIV-5B]|uniref:LURP-one-related/scramblase family protein n=1 Tax=Halococcus sp. IIIV-5B TaxID=2321230 RepID=UPI000E70F2A7|nr:hypothetical protein [Halococcus sp. IIIV-5B]RJT05386.1 hypothetical protein D3261_06800 [Halococcus sp. IIIV-5B]